MTSKTVDNCFFNAKNSSDIAAVSRINTMTRYILKDILI